MIVEGIISVAGKPGLYKVVGQTKNGVIVEGLADNKRLAMNSSSKMSALQDIAIYTYTEEIPLVDVLDMIRLKEAGKPTIGHKSSSNVLLSYFREILKDFDEDRVYPSDIKKVISWYNTLQKAGLAIETVEEKDEAVEKPKAKAKAKPKTKEPEGKPKAKAKAKPKTKEAEDKPKAKAKPKAKKE
ncbi:MAG: DUF5606 domain-containing protein [Flavobacteriales bacterium]|nr:DUF5606 domain-containing protein [Flavobacteriales bacterium]MDG1395351.1 DUF5606 domain-containing protein [Flavobacteriales bacterium]